MNFKGIQYDITFLAVVSSSDYISGSSSKVVSHVSTGCPGQAFQFAL